MIVKVRKRGNKWGSWMHVPTSQEELEKTENEIPSKGRVLYRQVGNIILKQEAYDGHSEEEKKQIKIWEEQNKKNGPADLVKPAKGYWKSSIDGLSIFKNKGPKKTEEAEENLPSFTRPDYKKAFEEKQEKETTGLKIGGPRITSSQDSLPLENFGRKIITETPISKALDTLASNLSQTINKAAHELANWLTGETLNLNLFLPIQTGKRIMNWESFSTAAEFLLPKINKKQFTCIYGQPRGGLILAVILSHKLGLPLSLTPYPSMLWCDDIVDSGNTYLKMKQKFPKAIYCSLLAKKFQNEVLHAFDYSDKNEWIIFPWETKESTEGQ